LGLDEAYLDVTENLQNITLARDVALAIRAKIKEVTGLNCCTARNMSVIVFQKFPNLLGFRFRNPASNVRNTVRNTSAIVRDP
jgi:hypothetical protein